MRMSDRGRGRPLDTRLGEDLAVLFALSRAGAQASRAGLSQLAGTTDARTEEIISSLSGSQTELEEETAPMLPIYETESGTAVARVDAAPASPVRPLRLTEAQAREMCEGLGRLGFSQNDDLVRRLRDAFFPIPPKDSHASARSDKDVEAPIPTMAATPSEVGEFEPGTQETLLVIARSLASARPVTGDPSLVSQQPISFRYLGMNDAGLNGAMVRTRRAIPRSVRAEDGHWVADTFDLDARGARTFRVCRMEAAACLPSPMVSPRTTPDRPDGGVVTVTCTPDAAREVRQWEGARVVGEAKDGLTVIEVPYYRGDWLPRHLLALGSAVSHDSPHIAEEMRAIAKEDLTRYRKLRERIS